ncbi:Hypothetical predicted protein [Prunus dulcis]|uniref:Uncharacterized protein n=1 Tax=Prunus dulcis TaxID=3755 RepID=A0A5E4FKX5_PRUDU|nr:Hypothetical predicted protein [Prunus dulcis]
MKISFYKPERSTNQRAKLDHPGMLPAFPKESKALLNFDWPFWSGNQGNGWSIIFKRLRSCALKLMEIPFQPYLDHPDRIVDVHIKWVNGNLMKTMESEASINKTVARSDSL